MGGRDWAPEVDLPVLGSCETPISRRTSQLRDLWQKNTIVVANRLRKPVRKQRVSHSSPYRKGHVLIPTPSRPERLKHAISSFPRFDIADTVETQAMDGRVGFCSKMVVRLRMALEVR